VKSSGNPKTLITAIRREVRDLDPHLPMYDVRTFTELVETTMSQERLIAAASSLFGLLALLLAAIGLYGVIACGVARRTREIGIRMALGAPRTNVFWLVQRETVVLVMIGIGVGLPAALATTRLVRSRLFGLSAMDPLTISVAIGVLIAVALVAGYLPARRAGKVDPMEALRTE
jgi:ABC-type antimicrobial peptide transport system permease subunit